MNQEVFFTNIRKTIIDNLQNCNSDLKIAVAWFTDKNLINEVNKLIKKGVKVEIIIYDDHVNQKELFKDLYYNKVKIFLSKKLMHNKFCVIDNKTVINGSYNWTFNASTNEENIQITHDNYDFAKKFNSQFEKLANSCKPIDDFFEYSLENLDDIEWEFRNHISQQRQSKFPYFYSLQNLELTKPNKFFKKLKIGYYLIKNENEEEEFLRTKYFVESKYSLIKINNILKRKTSLPQFFDFIPSLKNTENSIFFFEKEKYRVEVWGLRKDVFFIDRLGEVIGEKIHFSDKLPNGVYLKYFNSYGNNYLYDENLKKYNLGINDIEVHNEIGMIGALKIEKYKGEYKYGLRSFINKTIVDFKYDCYEIDENKKQVNFMEFPHIRKTENDKITYLRKPRKWEDDFKGYPYKTTAYNYEEKELSESTKTITPKNENIEDYFFLSDENEKYLSLYIALSNNRYGSKFSHIDTNRLSYTNFEFYKSHISGYKNISGQSYLEAIDRTTKHFRNTTRKNNKKDGCYIATLVYKDINHPKVELLQKYRDEELSKKVFGRIFIKSYYLISPKLIPMLRKTPLIQKLIKTELDKFIGKLKR